MNRLKDIGTVVLIIAVIIGVKYLIDRPDGPPYKPPVAPSNRLCYYTIEGQAGSKEGLRGGPG